VISDSFKQDLLNRVDIVDLIERYVPLKRGGANLLACCPFHSEKTPSFTVSPAKQFYHCFGCGAHGNAISFLMEYQGMDYVGAVRELAESVGMKLPEFEPRGAKKDTSHADLPEIMERATRYYREQLKAAPPAIEYLKGRGLTGVIAARFGIGYAPAGWQNLRSVFTDYDGKSLKQAGLVVEGEGGRRYDRFRDRIMFPILSQRGAVIAFGARVLGEGEPKYLNSPETPLFEKGRELYGLPQARNAIRTKGRVIVVEGYMDVVALAQHGFEYSVATLGTATTSTHIQKLFRQTDEVVFCFDGDPAGRRAAAHALEVALPVLADNKLVRFLFLPPEDDPDSYVRSRGAQAFEALIGEAMPLSEFFLTELRARAGINAKTPEGRSRLVAEAKPLLKQVAAPALQLQILKQLAEAADMSQEDVARLTDIRSVAGESRRSHPVPGRRASVDGMLERHILALLVVYPELAARLERELFDAGRSEDRTVLAVADFVADHLTPMASARAYYAVLLDHFAGTEHEGAIREAQAWAEEGRVDRESAEVVFGSAMDRRRERVEAARHAVLMALIQEGAASADQVEEFKSLSSKKPHFESEGIAAEKYV
jgi:DNA primase